jgi:hypothetical protein
MAQPLVKISWFFLGTYGLVNILNVTRTSLENVTKLPSLFEDDLSQSNETALDCQNQPNITRIGPQVTNLSEIPAKEIIIVFIMLGLWLYSIVLTRKAWYRLLKE